MKILAKLSSCFAALLCAAFVTPATAGPRENQIYQGDKPAWVKLPEQGAVAPLLSAGSHPAVKVTIQGHTYRFQVETGAWFNSISREAAEELGLRPDGEGQVALEGLEVGGAKFGRIRAAVLDRPPGGDDGQLGLPAFADLLLTVDFPKQQLRFSRGSLPAANDKDILPLQEIGPLWGVAVNIGGKPFTGFIDTQSGNGLAMAPPLAQQVSFQSRMVVTGRVRGPAIGDAEVKTGRLAGELAFGGYHFKQPIVSSFPVALRFPHLGVWMGPPLLQNFSITLDQKNRLARFERNGDPVIPAPPPLARLGLMVVHQDDGSLVIAGVEPGGDAAKAGVSEGDLIVAVEGTKTSQLAPGVERAIFTGSKPIKFRVSHGGSERDVEVAPKVFVQ
jgi:hypothetical protein